MAHIERGNFGLDPFYGSKGSPHKPGKAAQVHWVWGRGVGVAAGGAEAGAGRGVGSTGGTAVPPHPTRQNGGSLCRFTPRVLIVVVGVARDD